MVNAGELRFVLNLTKTPQTKAQEQIIDWVQDHCPAVELDIEGIGVRGPCEM